MKGQGRGGMKGQGRDGVRGKGGTVVGGWAGDGSCAVEGDFPRVGAGRAGALIVLCAVGIGLALLPVVLRSQ